MTPESSQIMYYDICLPFYLYCFIYATKWQYEGLQGIRTFYNMLQPA
jgi:hypothetical protein